MNKSKLLKELLQSKNTLIMPDAYDGLSAKLIEKAGFLAVQCSGYSISLAKQIINEKNLSLEDNLKITEEIIKSTDIPIMADGENGYGNNNILSNNIKKFISIGTSGINIEDQNFNQNNNNKIIDVNEMIDKIKIIKKTINNSTNRSFILNARTDALLIDDRKKAQKIAIERANNYLENGADLAFICYTKTYDELKLFSKEITGPISIAVGLPYNYKEFSIKDCQELGIARVSLPTYLIFNTIKYLFDDLKMLKKDLDFKKIRNENKIIENISSLLS